MRKADLVEIEIERLLAEARENDDKEEVEALEKELVYLRNNRSQY